MNHQQLLNPDNITIEGLTPEGSPPRAATRNACKLCTPLGAAMVFKGIRGCLPFLHGSQGCATYIRRYMISHFREPVDIASSSFSEDDAIFGGARNFENGLNNVIHQYQPEMIGVGTTCLSETIGDHMTGMIHQYKEKYQGEGPPLVHVSTPAYSGTHSDGYLAAIREIVRTLVPPTPANREKGRVNLIPPMASCADLRELASITKAFGLTHTLLPDFRKTLEGGSWDRYHRLSPGGTPVESIRTMGHAEATLEFGSDAMLARETGGSLLERHCDVPLYRMAWPLGMTANDQLLKTLSDISGNPIPDTYEDERGRLIDAMVDAHKITSGRRAVVFGEPAMVTAIASFLSEIGIHPVVVATGAKNRELKKEIPRLCPDCTEPIEVIEGADHALIAERVRQLKPDLLVGSSKGYPMARENNIPLVRLGFPIHDRVGSQRIQTFGFRGTLDTFDRIVNALLEDKQTRSSTGYSYL